MGRIRNFESPCSGGVAPEPLAVNSREERLSSNMRSPYLFVGGRDSFISPCSPGTVDKSTAVFSFVKDQEIHVWVKGPDEEQRKVFHMDDITAGFEF